LYSLLSPFFFASCNKDDDKIEAPLGAYDNGVLILNQGTLDMEMLPILCFK
jgi:hypothetical protein